MSADTTGAPEAIELPAGGDAAFATLMDTLVSAEDTATSTAGDTPAGAPAAGDGQPAAAGEGAGAAGADAAAPTAGEPGVAGVPATGTPAEPAGAGPGADPAWTVDVETLAPKWGEISTALEASSIETAQRSALDEVREEFPRYFEALEMHPRLLVGKEVPAIGGKEGEMETLRDSTDAAEWKEAVKAVLVAEVKDRAVRFVEDNGTDLAIVHASIELFQNNKDLVPRTKQFDRELADRFATLATPYEVRVDGKLLGYSIPPQPLITQLRSQLIAERSARAAAPAAVAPAKTPAAAPVRKAPEPPQAGIVSKAGAGSEAEDFSTLFGTIGLPNFRI